MRLDSFEAMRRMLLTEVRLRRVMEFQEMVFEDAAVSTTIVLVERTPPSPTTMVEVLQVSPNRSLSVQGRVTISQQQCLSGYGAIVDASSDSPTVAVRSRMQAAGNRLGERFDVSFGIKTGDDDRFVTHDGSLRHAKRLLRGEDIHRFRMTFADEYVDYRPEAMRRHRKTARPGTSGRFEQPKVLVRDTGDSLEAAFDEQNYYVKDVLVITDSERSTARLKMLCGILNSSPMRFFYETTFQTLHVQAGELRELPVAFPDEQSPEGRSLLEVVGRLHQAAAASATPMRTELDDQLDAVVSEIYGLSASESEMIADWRKLQRIGA